MYRSTSWKPMGDASTLLFGDPGLMQTQQDPSTGQILQNLILPIDQALANKITYGDRTAMGTGVFGTGNFTPAGTPQSGIPSVFWILLGVGAWFMFRRR